MTLTALIVGLVALGLSLAALFVAVTARGTAEAVAGALARHRQSHADRSEERRALRHGPPPSGPATEELRAQDAPTSQRPAVPPLPRPGRIGSPAPFDTPEDTW